MTQPCGCCQGVETRTPHHVANRPGLPSIAYRVGTHADFLASMKASLSRRDLAALATLTARSHDDPAIAWLDAWATIADVLTFYQERIANEGYLRTAIERRSILELARLVGYDLKPGVASSVFLAYSLENGHEVAIPAGSRAQSVPGPGELPQSFETADDLIARAKWNVLDPRRTRPQLLKPDSEVVYFKGTSTNLRSGDRLLFVANGEPLIDEDKRLAVPRILETVVEPALDRTKVVLQSVELTKELADKRTPFAMLSDLTKGLTKAPSKPPPSAQYLLRDRSVVFGDRADTLPRLLGSLHPEIAPALYQGLANTDVGATPPVDVYVLRTRAPLFGHNASTRPAFISSDGRVFRREDDWPLTATAVTGPRLDLTLVSSRVEGQSRLTVNGRLGDVEFRGSGNLAPGSEFELGQVGSVTIRAAQENTVEMLIRFRAAESTVVVSFDNRDVHVLGAGALGVLATSDPIIKSEGPTTTVELSGIWQKLQRTPTEAGDSISLDAVYPRIVNGSWVVIERPGELIATKAEAVTERSRSDYGLSGRCTVIDLALPKDEPWLRPDDSFDVIRRTTALVESERLELAEEPVTDPDVHGKAIELAALYGRLEPGKWLIVSGERTDLSHTSGVPAAELVMLAAAEHGVAIKNGEPLPGDRPHTFITLSTDLAYRYKRDTVRVYGNVVRATHGETRHEILGSGDATQPFLTFPLKQLPLTYVSAATVSGIASTLEVRVNEVRWNEADRFAGLGPTDRRFMLRTDDDGGTSVVFGNGREGARPPTGVENVRARYRNGIGRSGNVKAGQITLLATRPLGVKEVINPLPATGGADREGRDDARRNTPLAVLALDHLVSVQDYADFARTFGGIAKAASARLHHDRLALVHVTISGAGDHRIEETSDVYRNLTLALRRFGDPMLPIRVDVRALRMLVVQARVQVADAYLWEFVEPRVRTAMLEAFAFDRRELGQDVSASEVLQVMQSVPGVESVDLDLLHSLPEDFTEEDLTALTRPGQPLAHHQRVGARLARVENGKIFPAELVVLSAAVPETLLLSEIER